MRSISSPPTAFSFLRTAYRICREFELAGLLARTGVYDKVSYWLGKKKP
jgi:hypothetical protein